MASDTDILQEQLLAARKERDESVRNFEHLQHELSASSAAKKELEAKLSTADVEIKRQARQLADHVAASNAAATAAASLHARLQDELLASQNRLSDSQRALHYVQSELERVKEFAASSLAAAAIESEKLLSQVHGLEARLSEIERQKLLHTTNQEQLKDCREDKNIADGGHAVGSVVVGFPQHHHEKHSHHAATDVSLPKRRSSDPPPASHAGAAAAVKMNQPLTMSVSSLQLTPSISALLSSAHLPAREPGLSRTKSGSKDRDQTGTSVTQVRGCLIACLFCSQCSAADLHQVFPKPAPDYKNLDKFKMKVDQIEKMTSHRTRKFYIQQNDLIDDIEESHATSSATDAPDGPAIDPTDAKTTLVQFPNPSCKLKTPLNSNFYDLKSGLICSISQLNPNFTLLSSSQILRVSLFFNVVLTILKIVISLQTGSLSVLASLMDSIMDIVSGIILMVCSKIAASRDPHLYPGGKSRAEPIGIVVFSVVMGMVSLNVILESVKILSANKAETIRLGMFGIIGLVTVVVTKGLLYLWCRGTKSSAAQVQSEEHRTDMGGNALSFIAVLIAFYVPNKGAWWMDASVAMVYSMFTIYIWGGQGLIHARTLVGRTADPQFIQQLTSIVYHHEPSKEIKVDTVRAYHYGSNFLVEVEIILPENMTVKESHELSESLLRKLERLPEVDRAFVHIDYEWDHDPSDDHKEV